MASCATERGWPSGADGFVKRLTETLSREAWALDEAVHKYGIVDYRQGRSAYRLTDPPPSAAALSARTRTLDTRAYSAALGCATSQRLRTHTISHDFFPIAQS